MKKQYLNLFRFIFSEMAAIMQGQQLLVHFWRGINGSKQSDGLDGCFARVLFA